MGYIKHHAIIVSTWSDKGIKLAHEKAKSFGLAVSDLVPSPVNSYASFLVAPDGSKEGWADSDEGDGKRRLFKDWLHKYRYGDGSSPLEWVELCYGHDDGKPEVVDHVDTVETGDDYTGPAMADE